MIEESEETEKLEGYEELEETEKDKPCWCFGDMDSSNEEDFSEYCEKCDLFESCFLETYGVTYSEWKNSESSSSSKQVEIHEDNKCESFGSMDKMRLLDKSMGFNHCENCSCYNECFNATYGDSEVTKVSLKKEDDKQHILRFLNKLPKEKVLVDFAFSKSRKIVKVGQLTHGVTIPKILNQIYPRGSEVLIFWNSESKALFFFGERGFVSEQNRELLVNLYVKGFSTFRNMVFVGKLNVVVIPRQFMQYFNADRKVNPQFDSSANMLFFHSNLSDIELDKIEREKQAKSYITHVVISKTDSKRLGYQDSSEYKQRQKFRTEGLS